MGSQAALQIDYPRLDEIRRQPPAWWHDVLALVHFSNDSTGAPAEIPTAHVVAPVLNGSAGSAELWRLPGPLQSGQVGRVRYRRNGHLLFASLSIPESEFSDDGQAGALRGATAAAYSQMFEALQTLGYPHPLRIWNVMPAINGAAGDGERYWQFNGARQDAFVVARRQIEGEVPAASAVGSQWPSALTVYCIAGNQAPIPLESPRQRSAWNYPAQFGPQSPTFSRACIDNDSGQTLFISGTASIVGHDSTHVGDAQAQTRETLHNIRVLVAVANERIGQPRYALERLHYKVYVRHAEHQPVIETELRRAIGPQARVLFLQADICRRELLLEIEAVGTPGTD